MKPTSYAYASIKAWESCRLTAYQDQAGIWTIGYGLTTGALDGIDVREGFSITQDLAEYFLELVVERLALDLSACLHARIPENQFDALVSLVYNIGISAFRRSTLLRRLNAQDPNAGDEILRWCHVRGRNGVMIESAGLKRRRAFEHEMFNTPRAA